MTPDRVLVTGAGGFIGRHVVAVLAAEVDTEVVPVEHRWSDIGQVIAAVGAGGVDRCLHLGWYASPRDYLTNAERNLESLRESIELVDWLARAGCRHVTIAGSCAEYAEANHLVHEDDEIAPWSVYGASKAALRLLLSSSLLPAGMSVAWARLFNLTGPGEHPDRLLPVATCALLDGREVALSPGEQRRDFLDVADVAMALTELSRVGAVGAFNVCSSDPVQLRELITQIGEAIGRPELLRFGERAYGEHDPMLVAGINGRLREKTDWEPMFTREQMIQRMIEYWRSQSMHQDVTAG